MFDFDKKILNWPNGGSQHMQLMIKNNRHYSKGFFIPIISRSSKCHIVSLLRDASKKCNKLLRECADKNFYEHTTQ